MWLWLVTGPVLLEVKK